jgi:hypothetical protein
VAVMPGAKCPGEFPGTPAMIDNATYRAPGLCKSPMLLGMMSSDLADAVLILRHQFV